MIFLLVFKLIKTFFLARYLRSLKSKSLKVGDYAVNFIRSIRPWFYISVALWIGFQFLGLSIFWSHFFDSLLIVVLSLQAANISKVVSRHFLKKAAGNQAVRDFSGIISFVISAFFIVVGLLLALAMMGVNVTSLIAGLGFGGVALALAAQKIFSDLFSSITVYIDRQFAVGDYIVVSGEGGRVEKIGWRSTRLRADSGEEVVIANSLLVAGKVNNFKKQDKRRGTLDFGFSLNNSSDKITQAHRIIAEAAQVAGLEISRASFVKTTTNSLVFQVWYFGPTDQEAYFAATEKFILKIKKRCEEVNLIFA
ncbi:MAG: mechanosensitive ion channel family protein [Candidatus Falkowbacteria bacterium]|nr:mechanosensitive ion channel family protein [Candidatus Falkowbacteria bacterium]